MSTHIRCVFNIIVDPLNKKVYNKKVYLLLIDRYAVKLSATLTMLTTIYNISI